MTLIDLDLRDRERCMNLAERVGWPREPAKWDLFFHMGKGYGIELAGTLTAMVVMEELEGATFVAAMAVDPAAQAKGHGRALLEHAMSRSTPPFMLYATEPGRRLYVKLGFHEVDRADRYVGPVAARAASGSTRAVRVEDVDRAALVAEDHRAFGFRRTRLLDALLARADRIAVDDRGGLAIRWYSGTMAMIGPVFAADEDAAIALVDRALENVEGVARIDVPVRSEKLRAHAVSRGLLARGDGPLMTAPAAFLPGDRTRYHALALQAFG